MILDRLFIAQMGAGGIGVTTELSPKVRYIHLLFCAGYVEGFSVGAVERAFIKAFAFEFEAVKTAVLVGFGFEFVRTDGVEDLLSAAFCPSDLKDPTRFCHGA